MNKVFLLLVAALMLNSCILSDQGDRTAKLIYTNQTEYDITLEGYITRYDRGNYQDQRQKHVWELPKKTTWESHTFTLPSETDPTPLPKDCDSIYIKFSDGKELVFRSSRTYYDYYRSDITNPLQSNDYKKAATDNSTTWVFQFVFTPEHYKKAIDPNAPPVEPEKTEPDPEEIIPSEDPEAEIIEEIE